MQQTNVHLCPAADRGKIEGMLPKYLAELGEAVDDYPYLALYWSEPGRWPYLIHQGSEIAGFAMIRRLTEQRCFEMSEFCVLPNCRRHGVGSSAVHQLLNIHHGTWSVAVLRTNSAGVAFWSRVLSAYEPALSATTEMLTMRFRTNKDDA